MFFFKHLSAIKGFAGNTTMQLESGYLYIIRSVNIVTHNDGANDAQGIRLTMRDLEGQNIRFDCYLNPSVPDRNQHEWNDLEILTDASTISMYLEDVKAGSRPTNSYCLIKYEKIEKSSTKNVYSLPGGII